jgi:hypothetical protein
MRPVADIDAEQVERFLATGAWAGGRHGVAPMRELLTRIVAWRAARAPGLRSRPPADPAAVVRDRIGSLIEGLFDPIDAATLIAVIPTRVRVLTPSTFPAAALAVPLSTAWDLANLLLDDLRVPTLSDDVPQLDGICAAGCAWVLPRAFAASPHSDVLVHEVAHLLHLLRRDEVGLSGEGLLIGVPPRRRETFAYACEAWAIALRAGGLQPEAPPLGQDDARVDRKRLERLLAEAAAGGGFGALRRWAEGSARG